MAALGRRGSNQSFEQSFQQNGESSIDSDFDFNNNQTTSNSPSFPNLNKANQTLSFFQNQDSNWPDLAQHLSEFTHLLSNSRWQQDSHLNFPLF